MELEIFTLCEFATCSSGQMTIVVTFDSIRSQLPSGNVPPFHFAGCIRFQKNEEGKHTLNVTVRDPLDQAFPEQHNVEFELHDWNNPEFFTYNFTLGNSGAKFHKLGKYCAVLSIDRTIRKRLFFWVTNPAVVAN
jgi:hypothetical protein